MKHADITPSCKGIASPPARGRGLKLGLAIYIELIRPSPPARGRGLKQAIAGRALGYGGRPPRGGVD